MIDPEKGNIEATPQLNSAQLRHLNHLREVINAEFCAQETPTLTVRTVADAIQRVVTEWRKHSDIPQPLSEAIAALDSLRP